MLIFLLLLLFWFLLSGIVNLEYFLVGLIIAGILTLLYYRMAPGKREMGININLRRVWLGVKIIGVLFLAIIRANLTLAVRLWGKKPDLQSVLFSLDLPLHTPGAINFAANAITLTPGTISASLRERRLIIHTLYPEQEQELGEWKLIKLLKEWEGEASNVYSDS